MDKLSLIKEQWQNFIEGKEVDSSCVRPMILQSWKRSRDYNVNPFLSPKALMLTKKQLDEKLKSNKTLIDIAVPFMNILQKSVEGSGFIITLADKDGYLLKVIGDPDVIESTAKIPFVPGCNRSEPMAGTNAIALALVENKPVQIVGPEHYIQHFHSSTCSSAPIHDEKGQTIGVLNVTGHYKLLHKHTLGMVVAVVEAIESQLVVEKRNRDILLLNNLLSSIIESFTDGLIATDSAGNITHANSILAKLLYLPKGDLKAHLQILATQNPGLRDLFTSKEDYNHKEISIKNMNRTRHFIASVNPIKSPNGSNLGKVIILRERKKVHRLVNRINDASAKFTFEHIKGKSAGILNAIEMAKKVAPTDARIILEGESGTGKELFVQSIHNASDRSNGPFIAINCAAIPRDLIESELFGYEEGSFTGAVKGGKPGKFELADGGTLFLDEVSELPLEMQAKLLRVLQEKQVVRIGGSDVIPLDVRIISATNKNLEQEVAKGNFRSDLFYRLNVITIKIPPLRERADDIPELAEFFCKTISEKLSISCPSISSEAMKLLVKHSWPGNVRELQNVIERAIILSDGDIIQPKHIKIAENNVSTPANFFLKPLDEIEKTAIQLAIKYTNGNVSKASRILNISRNTLYKKLKEIENM